LKKIISILGDYYKNHFNWLGFFLCALLGAVLIKVAYHNDFYLKYIERESNLNLQIIRYCELYAIAFIGAFILQGIAERDLKFLKSSNWWLLNLLAIVLFAIRGSDVDYGALIFGKVDSSVFGFYSKVAYNLGGFFTLILPCLVYWFFVDKRNQNFYGFKIKNVNLKPYFILLSMMIPLLFWAGTQPDFLDTYPRYTKIGISELHEHYKIYTGFYEIAYGSDFLFTEFFFRGFIVLAFATKFGHRAILPMCVYYITIHFGKPLGETISSFFGGLLLGVIAYRTKSIYGGIIVHLGIAYLMEIFAFLGRAGYLHF
jgi:membrane protease YdiL (CAAX protease family)